MSDLTAYLLAQARKQPLDTLRYCVSEALRRRRLQRAVAPPLREPPADGLAARFAPFLSGAPAPAAGTVPEALRQAVAVQAEQICSGEYAVLGKPVRLGISPDWHADWVSGHRWPLVPIGQLRLVDAAADADIKRPWELARFHHGVRLAQAWSLMRDPRYAEAFAAQVEHWLRHNPCPQGIHWAMPMEVALRAVNWTYAAALLADAPLQSQFWRKLLAALHQHGEYVYAQREWNPVARSNHYLACVVGLLCAGVVFRDTNGGRRWLEFGRRALCDEMAAQVHEDGVAHEGSTGYHSFVTELMLTGALPVARLDALEHGKNGSSGSPRAQLTAAWDAGFVAKLERMLDFCAVLNAGRAAPPIWGDCDDGRVLPFCPREAETSQHLLALGRELFAREDWPAGHACGEPLFRLSPAAFTKSAGAQPTSAAANRAFPGAGFYCFASQRLRGSIRCGPLGVNGWANHAHCDQLHIELCCDGQLIVADPGAYAYSGEPDERNRFRSTRAHNTPYVGDIEQNRFWEKLLFRMVDDTHAHCLQWQADEARVEFAGEHYGYRRLPQRVIVQRRLRFDRMRDTLLISDTLTGGGTVRGEWNFQLAPHLAVNPMESNTGVQPPADSGRLAVHSAWRLGPMTLLVCYDAPANLSAGVESGWVAPHYGCREVAPRLRISGRVALPARVDFLFAPHSEDAHT